MTSPTCRILFFAMAITAAAPLKAEEPAPKKPVSQDEKIAALEARVEKLEALVRKVTERQAVKKPTNKSGIPDAVMAKIREEVESIYPNNFTLQKILIDAEIKAYKDLNE